MNPSNSFVEIAKNFGIGQPVPAEYSPLSSLPLLVLVGVTGVGKSTTLEELRARGRHAMHLPDRRELTDKLIIGVMQVDDGEELSPVSDRRLRFEYSRRFRERYPGGMAYALSLLVVRLPVDTSMIIFDGLRGENEVRSAVTLLPRARFAMLDAPDAVRVARLLGRNDPFDRLGAGMPASFGGAEDIVWEDLGLGDAEHLFTPQERAALVGLVTTGKVTADNLRSKVQIVVEERRSYDPIATRMALESVAVGRSRHIDTPRHAPSVVARLLDLQITEWWFS
jgi:hypothetical protein